MKFATVISATLVICISEVLANSCPRTNRKPGSKCIDECIPSLGCSDSKKICVCDGDCGFSCVKKGMRCSPLKRLRNGKISGTDTTFNSTLTFQCKPKYTLFGSSVRRCRAKGLWDGKKSRCKIACPEPNIPKHTQRNRKLSAIGFAEGTTLHYGCSSGYETTNPLNIRCQSNGKWSSTPPVCKVPQCGWVILPANARVRFQRNWRNKTSHPLGTRIWFSCNYGFRSVPFLGRMECKRTGKWEMAKKDFSCIRKTCGDPGTPRNGKRSGLSFTFQDTVHYSCNNCYKLTGAGYRQCLGDTTWTGSLPTCTQTTCPSPPSLAHGTLRISSQPIYCGSYVDYACAIGYNLRGSNRRTCLGNGSWSDSRPTCEIVDCGDPGHPRNGQTTATGGFTYGNDITFSCDSNYVLEGSLLATCQHDGTWSKNLPTCLEKCSDPSGNTNARVIGNKFYHGEEVEFVCPRDHILVPSISRKLTCNDGTWGGQIPLCKESCPSLPRLPDGYKSRGRSRTHGSTVEFRCTNGHRLVGSSSLRCNDGNWSSRMPKCLAICSTIQRIDRGWVYGRRYLEGDVLRFRCQADHILDGASAIECTGNRRWNASKPTCRAPCTKLPAPTNGNIRQGGFRHRERRQFECLPDYHLEGRATLTCVDGRWDYSPPACLAPCSQFDAEPFFGGYKIRDGFRHNEEVVFGCKEPFVIDGGETLRCNNGRWSKQLPFCGGPCQKFPAPTNGFIRNNGYKHKESVIFGCRQGFQMLGEPERKCNFGTWSNSNIPQCEAKCSDPSRRTNARVVGNEFYNGKKVKFVCSRKDEVLDPEVSKELTCNKGRWSGIIPSCKASCPSLSQIPNGNITGGKNRKHGSIVQFSCNPGYQQFGVWFTLCNDGRWSDDVPKCLAICRRITSISNGRVIGRGEYEGDKISFVCDRDYVLRGEKAIRCTSTGAWNASVALCERKAQPSSTDAPSTTAATTTSATTTTATQAQAPSTSAIVTSTADTTKATTQVPPKNCADIKKIRKGNVHGDGVSPGSKRTFSCIKNWRLSGVQGITCMSNGEWSDPLPKCVPNGPPISCKVVGKIQNGFARINETFHGGRVVFVCNPNYTLVGKAGLLCRSGKWSRTPPKCYAPCKDLGAPKNGSIIKSGIKHNDGIGFTCNQGYTLKGVGALKCNDGSWDAPPPTCQQTS